MKLAERKENKSKRSITQLATMSTKKVEVGDEEGWRGGGGGGGRRRKEEEEERRTGQGRARDQGRNLAWTCTTTPASQARLTTANRRGDLFSATATTFDFQAPCCCLVVW